MKNQKEQGKKLQKKKPFKILFSVDDIHPEIGYGLYKENDNFKYLLRLYKEFGLKFTLFIVPKWMGQEQFEIKKHIEWIQWIQQQNCFEIAGHGVMHLSNVPEQQHLEFYNLTKETVEQGVLFSKQLFQECGVEIKGWKSPGWLHSNDIYECLGNAKYDWIADHIFGERPIRLSNGLVQIPYNCSTEELEFAYPENAAIFHSHINSANDNLNGWTEERYLQTREFLIKLQKEYDFVPMTFSEYVEDFKNGKNKN